MTNRPIPVKYDNGMETICFGFDGRGETKAKDAALVLAREKRVKAHQDIRGNWHVTYPIRRPRKATQLMNRSNQIWLASYWEDKFRFQLLNDKGEAKADCLMDATGNALDVNVSVLLNEQEQGLFVAGCRNIVLNSKNLAEVKAFGCLRP